jgi:hypothetical protein
LIKARYDKTKLNLEWLKPKRGRQKANAPSGPV